jgi:hypothetical protein
MRGRRSVLTAIVVVLRCWDGTRHRILWTATRGTTGREERLRQLQSLVDGVVLELNDEIIDAAETVPPGRRRQVVLDLGEGGGELQILDVGRQGLFRSSEASQPPSYRPYLPPAPS